jgi:hypothetical protein
LSNATAVADVYLVVAFVPADVVVIAVVVAAIAVVVVVPSHFSNGKYITQDMSKESLNL